MKRLSCLTVLILVFSVSSAQYFQTGQDPASIRWRQIHTANFQLIYPDYYENQAQKLAYVLEKVYKYGSYSLNHQPKKISVILHTQTVKSNGLVAWAPKRSEFYTTPHQEIYPQDWLEQLALHEFRHVVQVDKIDSEMPKIFKILLGEQGTALVFGAYLPWWFIEGDAVVTETALSNYGRGRFPSFLMEHQAQVVEKGVFSYDKAYNGSFKDYVPNHYQLGYYLVGNTRAKYGSGIWDSVVTRVGKKPLSVTPFNTALKRATGLTKVKLYHSVFDSLQMVWRGNDKMYSSIPVETKSPKSKKYTSYNYNHWLNDSTIISYKSSFDQIPAFVKIDKFGKEKKVFSPGTIFNESVNYRDEWIVWSEQISDVRWTHSGKSLIRLLNIHTQRTVEIKPDFKGFSPAISDDKTRVAVVETDFSNNNYLSVYSLPGGDVLKRLQAPDNNYLFSPEWLDDDNLAVIILTEKGKRLAKMNLDTGGTEILVNKDLGEIKQLKFVGGRLYFICSYSGKNALYSYEFKSGDVHLLYEPRFGVESPAISENKIILLSDYTAGGFRIIQLPGGSENSLLLDSVLQGNYVLAEKLAAQEPGITDFTLLDTVRFESKKYNKPTNLFNFHSWAPVSVDVETYEFMPGVSLMSQNKLGTAETVVGYEWDYSEKAGKYYARYVYKGWYPVFSFDVNIGERSSEYYLVQQTKNQAGQIIRQDTSLQRVNWKQTNAELNVKVPFVFDKGVFRRIIQPEICYTFTQYKQEPSSPEEFFDGNYQTLSYRFYFHQLMNQSYQDVYPNFGVVVDGNYQHSPLGDTDFGNIAFVQSYLYLPGLMANHGTKIYLGAQKKNTTDKFSFSDVIRYPSGWGKYNTTSMFSTSFNYKLPLLYPDLSIGGLMYLQRIDAAVFGDFAQLKGNIYKENKIVGTFSKNISSYGTELTGTANFLRFYAPATIGVRASYLPELKNVYFNFLFSVDFNSL